MSSAAHLRVPSVDNTPLTPNFRKADKLRTQQQLEALQNRYVGTGHADTTAHEFKVNGMRDYYSSMAGHPALLSYTALGMGESREKVRLQMIHKMIQPAGKAPPVQD
ncbi:splicing factor 3B subunit 10-domain-containing protein [Phyllosticta capitalensis]|uniref:splicing factor 3B subunit 10-domain-containing protein n=1 Tax=Phyllosticta capitalensis TaxID=121624 RepID=UPI00313154F0